MKKTLLSLSALCAVSAFAHGNHSHDEKDKHAHSHDEDVNIETIAPHVHGHGTLNVVLDGDKLTIDLDSPAMNVIGFEHKPETEAHLETSHKALHALKDAEWLSIKGGDCRLHDVDLDWEYKAIVHNHFHSGDMHDEHKHDEHKHDEHKHDEHKHDEHKHDEHKHDEHKHSDITANYQLSCDKPEKIDHISVNLFDTFSGFEQINVQWIKNSRQGIEILKPHYQDLHFDK